MRLDAFHPLEVTVADDISCGMYRVSTPGTVPDEPSAPLKIDRALLEAHGPWMLALARRILDDAHLAEDAVQEAFLAAHANQNRFEGRSSVRTWLYRVTVNAALGLQRRRNSNECNIDELQPSFDASACRIEEPWGKLRTPEEVLEEAELCTFVQQCVERLPGDYRICLQLRDLEELSVREVADLLDISPENVKVRTHRARSALKRLMEPLLRGKPAAEIMAAELPIELKPSLARAVKGVMMNYLPMMLTCERFEDFIIDYLEGDLPEDKRKLFNFHIRTCRECREYLSAYKRTREIAREVAEERTRMVTTLSEVPEDLLNAVIQATEG